MSAQKDGSCQIHLLPQALERAWDSLYMRHVQANENKGMTPGAAREDARAQLDDFTGPHFKDCVLEVDFLTPGWVHVTLRGGTLYSYPAGDVARVKTYKAE